MREEKESPQIPWEWSNMPTPPNPLPKEAVLSPEAAVALNLDSLTHYGIDKGTTRDELVDKLYDRGKELVAGDFTMVKRMLAAQLTMLERLANYFIMRGYSLRDFPERHDRLMRMAMRAQNQFVRTAEALKKISKDDAPKQKAKATAATERGIESDRSVRSDRSDGLQISAEQPPSDCCCPAP